MSDAAALIKGLVAYAGGLAEETGGDKVLVLLPPERAAAAETPESMELPAGPGLFSETDLLERLGRLLGEGGRRETWWPGELYLKRDGVEEMVLKELSALNGLLSAGRPYETFAAYDTYTYKYSAVSEEADEGLVRVCVNAMTATPVPGMMEALESLPRREDDPPACPVLDTDEASFAAASREAERTVRERLAPLSRGLDRRLRRDERRLKDYYGALADQVDRRRTRTSGPGRDEKKAAITRELDRKLRELDSRYAVRVGMEPVAVSRAVLPVVVVPLTAVRRKTERKCLACWNPVLKSVEPVSCASCLGPTKSFHLCDREAHPVCPACARARDLRRACPACGK